MRNFPLCGLIRFVCMKLELPCIVSHELPTDQSLEQTWTFALIPKSTTITGLVSLSLDPATANSDFIQVKYHKEQANDKDYSHQGLGFNFKKWQADHVAEHMDSEEVKYFEKDKGAGKEEVRKYGSDKPKKDAPVKDL